MFIKCELKIFTKVLNNRILKVADKLIGPSQTSFISGRYIMEGVVILHETIHELHRKKLNVIIFKVDSEKAYNKVKWSFFNKRWEWKILNESISLSSEGAQQTHN